MHAGSGYCAVVTTASSRWPEGYRFTPLPASEEEGANTYRDAGYDWCRPCGEWHRPPECPINERGEPAPTWGDPS
jgi:hypothetical protein